MEQEEQSLGIGFRGGSPSGGRDKEPRKQVEKREENQALPWSSGIHMHVLILTAILITNSDINKNRMHLKHKFGWVPESSLAGDKLLEFLRPHPWTRAPPPVPFLVNSLSVPGTQAPATVLWAQCPLWWPLEH